MHTIVFRREVYEANRGPPRACTRRSSGQSGGRYAQLMETDALKLTLPWVVAETEETRRVMGDDFWPYGIEPNRVSLEALPQYLYEQHLITRVPKIEELFARIPWTPRARLVARPGDTYSAFLAGHPDPGVAPPSNTGQVFSVVAPWARAPRVGIHCTYHQDGPLAISARSSATIQACVRHTTRGRAAPAQPRRFRCMRTT